VDFGGDQSPHQPRLPQNTSRTPHTPSGQLRNGAHLCWGPRIQDFAGFPVGGLRSFFQRDRGLRSVVVRGRTTRREGCFGFGAGRPRRSQLEKNFPVGCGREPAGYGGTRALVMFGGGGGTCQGYKKMMGSAYPGSIGGTAVAVRRAGWASLKAKVGADPAVDKNRARSGRPTHHG